MTLFSLERRGPDDGPRVVIIHGLLDRCSSFTRVARYLGDATITMYDRSGSGRSNPGQGPVSMARHVTDLLEIIGAEPSVVVGHSFGGVVALAAACVDPGAFRSVGAFEAPLLWLPWWQHPEELPEAGSTVEQYVRGLAGDGKWATLRRGRQAMLEAEAAALDGDRRTLESAPFALDDVTVPVVAGSATGSPEHLRHGMRELARVHPLVSHHELDGEPAPGHNAHVTHPAAFAAYVRRCIHAAALTPSIER